MTSGDVDKWALLQSSAAERARGVRVVLASMTSRVALLFE